MDAGTFNCPICDDDTPHEHTSNEVAQFKIGQTFKNKAHWHLENRNHATAQGYSYYPAIITGTGVELGYVRSDTAEQLVKDHNNFVDTIISHFTK